MSALPHLYIRLSTGMMDILG